MKLAYELWNPQELKKAPHLVLLHGMGGTGALWRPLAAGLEDEMILLAPDQRGHGKSQIPAVPGSRNPVGYTPLDYGRDLIETLDSLSFHPTWILGHSMGVRTAVAAAHLRREWVQGLVLVDLGFSGVAGGGLGEGLAEFLKKLPPRFSTRTDARAFMQENCPDPSIAQYLIAVSKLDPEGRVYFPFDHAALVQTIHAARDASVRTWVEDLAKQQLPIRVLRGQNSLVWSHEDFNKEKARFAQYPSVRFEEVPNSGHGLPFEQRLWLTSFLKSLVNH